MALINSGAVNIIANNQVVQALHVKNLFDALRGDGTAFEVIITGSLNANPAVASSDHPRVCSLSSYKVGAKLQRSFT
jgi:hypothetical protein